MIAAEDVHRFATERFAPAPGYLNTAAVGLPHQAGLAEIRRRLEEWEAGGCEPPSFDTDVARARAAFASIVGMDVGSVAIGGPVSVGVGLVASSLPAGAVVLCPEEEFTSVLFPFLADGRLDVRTAPLDSLLDALSSDVDLVAASAAQSADGRVLDLDELAATAQQAGVRTLVDATQAAGWLPIDAGRFDVTVCHAYKWLCSPRGAGFLTATEDARGWLIPRNAGWYAGDDPWDSIYRPPLRLASDARRFDCSPDWFSFVGTAPTLELFAELGAETVGAYSVGLANRFRELVGLERSNSAIVSVDSPAGDALTRAGIVTSARAGRIRLSFYLYNTIEDVERAAEIIGPCGT